MIQSYWIEFNCSIPFNIIESNSIFQYLLNPEILNKYWNIEHIENVCSTSANANQVSVQLALRASFIFESAPPALLVWLKTDPCWNGPICPFIQYFQFYQHLFNIPGLNKYWKIEFDWILLNILNNWIDSIILNGIE